MFSTHMARVCRRNVTVMVGHSAAWYWHDWRWFWCNNVHVKQVMQFSLNLTKRNVHPPSISIIHRHYHCPVASI